MAGSATALLLTSQADSRLAPALHPAFLGSRPAVWCGSMCDKGSPFFQDCCNGAVARATMHDCERTAYSARPDRVGNWDWDKTLPKVRTYCSWIAPAQRSQTDAFYMLCQQHRDQLRDHSGRLHPLDFFDIAETPFQCPVDLFTTYQRYPTTFTKYRAPQSQPLAFGRTNPMPSLPARSLVGDYNQYSDTSWKGQSKVMFT